MIADYTNDILLLKQLKAQDIKAFNYLYTNNRKWLYVLALSIVKDTREAQGLVQELFLELWQQVHITTSIKSYLSSAVKDKAYSFIKSGGQIEHYISLSNEFVFPA